MQIQIPTFPYIINPLVQLPPRRTNHPKLTAHRTKLCPFPYPLNIFEVCLENSTLAPPFQTPTPAASPNPENHHNSSDPYTGNNSFNSNIVMVLSVLLCALICSLGLNSIIWCAIRCSSLVALESGARTSAGLPNTRVKRKAFKTFPIVNYSANLKLPGLDSECVICLPDFTAGDRVRLLSKCNHGCHVQCIDKWLSTQSSCPKCRHCLIATCQKIVGCSQASSSEPPPVQETIVTVTPLDPEGLIHSYR